MHFESIIPHLIASLTLLEAQINEWDRNLIDKALLPSEKEEYKSVRSILLEMRKTINLFQLANAREDTLESFRLVKVFYGCLWMIRPSINKTQEILMKTSGTEINHAVSQNNEFDYMLVIENAH
jgi:hypothetical protein